MALPPPHLEVEAELLGLPDLGLKVADGLGLVHARRLERAEDHPVLAVLEHLEDLREATLERRDVDSAVDSALVAELLHLAAVVGHDLELREVVGCHACRVAGQDAVALAVVAVSADVHERESAATGSNARDKTRRLCVGSNHGPQTSADLQFGRKTHSEQLGCPPRSRCHTASGFIPGGPCQLHD
eukprot:scaffold92624_cov54-Phaeocystis_antarctica.AAC.4